jgi:hypothetical protein
VNWLAVIGWTLGIELLTVLLRFGMKLQARKFQGKWPLRIHHGYVGILFLIFGFLPEFSTALILSDVMHHFVVLPLTIRRTEFP